MPPTRRRKLDRNRPINDPRSDNSGRKKSTVGASAPRRCKSNLRPGKFDCREDNYWRLKCAEATATARRSERGRGGLRERRNDRRAQNRANRTARSRSKGDLRAVVGDHHGFADNNRCVERALGDTTPLRRERGEDAALRPLGFKNNEGETKPRECLWPGAPNERGAWPGEYASVDDRRRLEPGVRRSRRTNGRSGDDTRTAKGDPGPNHSGWAQAAIGLTAGEATLLRPLWWD
jgi:hypothetical protein